MKRLTFASFALILGATVGTAPAASAKVEMRGLKPSIKLEEPVSGFLSPLNGLLKLRATEVEFAPGSSLGAHYHPGPGIRYVASGELTVTDQDGHVKIVRQGDYFYEAGDRSLRVSNRERKPAKLIIFELLPADWQGGSTVPLSSRNDLAMQGKKLRGKICGK